MKRQIAVAAFTAASFVFVLVGGEGPFETGLEAISDVRVAPMTASRWTQNVFGGASAFNLYNPNGYPSGCTVAAFAQVMRYWEHPKDAVVPGSYLCWSVGFSEMHEMIGGVYDWDLMPLVEEDCTTDAQREMLGRLTYDLCVASQTAWDVWSATYSAVAAEALQNRFGYAMTRSFYPPEGTVTSDTNIIDLADYRNAILASLDAGMPVVLGLVNTNGVTHQAVVDGYGFNGGTDVYCHLNCGWAGTDDRWYNILAEGATDQFHFTALMDVTYNIHPREKGDVISGRVLDELGAPVPNVKVTLSGAASGETKSNEKGIFFFRVSGAGKFVLSAVSESLGRASRTVTVAKGGESVEGKLNEEDRTYLASSLGVVANRWGEDLVLSDKEEPFKATAAAIFDGWLTMGDVTVGTVLVKVGKANRNTGESKLTATVIRRDTAKKLSYKGIMRADGEATLSCSGQPDMNLFLGIAEMKGALETGCNVAGTRNRFTSRDKGEADKANSELAHWLHAINVAWPDGAAGWNGLGVTVAKKGKVKVSGTLADGSKISASAQAILMGSSIIIPVVNTKKAAFSFNLSLPLSGGSVGVSGLDGAIAGEPKPLVDAAEFKMDATIFGTMLGGDTTFASCLPDGISVKQNGTKWVVANGARPGKVVFKKGTEEIDLDKAGDNPSALKLSFAVKTGVFKGSFKAYRKENGRPKSISVTVMGVMVGDVGYGAAIIKRTGSVSVVLAKP